MSEYERNKGKLVPTHIDTEHYTDDDWDTLYENGMVNIYGEAYLVEWDVKGRTDQMGFSQVHENEDGSIDFHTLHYNGGGHWTELVKRSLEEGNEYSTS